MALIIDKSDATVEEYTLFITTSQLGDCLQGILALVVTAGKTLFFSFLSLLLSFLLAEFFASSNGELCGVF